MTEARQQSKKHRFDTPEQEVFLNLWRTYDCLKALEDELFSQFQLSAQQYNALRLLRSVYPDSMQTLELGRELISRCPDITRMLDRLERRGLIRRRRPAANRRVVEVVATKAALALLEKLQEPVREMHDRQLGRLTRSQQRTLLELLKLARQPLEDATCDWLDD